VLYLSGSSLCSFLRCVTCQWELLDYLVVLYGDGSSWHTWLCYMAMGTFCVNSGTLG